jgi:transcription antitermination factor NusG
MDIATMPLWYAIATRSRHEKAVHARLLGRQIEAFLPLAECWNRWKDRTARVEAPLFPGYCFARFPLTDRLRVMSLGGVVSIMGTAGRPEPIEEKEIDTIRRLVETKLRHDPHPFLVEGMEVEVVRGPLTGVRGRLIHKDRKTRLVLGVRLIRQAVMVEIHPADVAPL